MGLIIVFFSVGFVVFVFLSCIVLEFCGVLVEGGSFSFKVVYKGGEKGVCM